MHISVINDHFLKRLMGSEMDEHMIKYTEKFLGFTESFHATTFQPIEVSKLIIPH